MKNIILICLLLGNSYLGFSSAILAGEMTQTALGGNTYETTVTLINDCSGDPAPSSVNIHYECIDHPSLSFDSLAYPMSGTGIEVSFSHIYKDTTSCNGGTAFGCKEYTYRHVIELNSAYNWKLWIKIQGRGQVHSNPNNASQHFYLEMIHNISIANSNSTPIFSYKTHSRVISNYNYCYNQGAIDLDGDSLSFNLVHPLLDSTSQLQYNYPYTPVHFLPSSTPIYIDSTTGDICFTASQEFKAITKVQIQEWRTINNQAYLISSTQRDLMFYTEILINHPPVLTGMDTNLKNYYDPYDTIFYTEIYAGDTLNFRVHAYDIDSGLNANCGNAHHLSINIQSLSDKLDHSMFQIYNYNDTAYADFYWITDWSDIQSSPHTFTLRVGDHWQSYVQSGSDTFRYQILVKENPVGIDETEPLNADLIEVYPNPATEKAILEFDKMASNVRVDILDINGRVLMSEDYQSTQRINLNLDRLTNGVYVIRVNTSDQTIFKKLLIE